MTNKLVEEKKVYISGHWESFNALVRCKGLSAYSEVGMRRNIKDYKANKHSVVIRDLEFPIDDEGNYIQPPDNSQSSYSHKFNSK